MFTKGVPFSLTQSAGLFLLFHSTLSIMDQATVFTEKIFITQDIPEAFHGCTQRCGRDQTIIQTIHEPGKGPRRRKWHRNPGGRHGG
jgi:hypothetical protein